MHKPSHWIIPKSHWCDKNRVINPFGLQNIVSKHGIKKSLCDSMPVLATYIPFFFSIYTIWYLETQPTLTNSECDASVLTKYLALSNQNTGWLALEYHNRESSGHRPQCWILRRSLRCFQITSGVVSLRGTELCSTCSLPCERNEKE